MRLIQKQFTLAGKLPFYFYFYEGEGIDAIEFIDE